MKKIFSLSIFMMILINLGCKKDKNKEIEIDADHLTTCPNNTTCTYVYHDDADFGNPLFLNLQKGKYKIFKYSALLGNGFYAKHVYIRVPANVTKFELNNEQVIAGEVKFANPCASCDLVGVKIVGGDFKGIKTSGAKNANWLLDGKIYLSTIVASSYRDTIRIKQYFAIDPAGI